MKKIVLSLGLLLSVTSCATYISGKTQIVKVNSEPAGADCAVSNEVSGGNVRTPGTIELTRSKKTVTVNCSIPNYGTGTKSIEPGANILPLAANIVNFGVGYIYDVSNGASWKFPETIDVVIQPNGRVLGGNFNMAGYGTNTVAPQNNNYNIYSPRNLQNPNMPNPYSTQPGSLKQYPANYNASDLMPNYTNTSYSQQQYQQQQAMQPQQQYQPQQPQQYQAPANPMQDVMKEREAITAEGELGNPAANAPTVGGNGGRY